jgi:NADPH-dependent glutamate synthase beta subunit-like oxidoreductase
LSRKPEIEGRDLDGLMWGLEFLRAVNLGRTTGVKGKVLVIGGGDVAMDAALCSVRLGAMKVEVACLESREQMPAHQVNIQRALEEGVRIANSWSPGRIRGRDGKVTGVDLVRCTSVFDDQGRFDPRLEKDVRESVDADVVILSVGQACDLSGLPEKMTGPDGTIPADPVSLETAQSGVFAGGDAVTGPSSVVEAIASGKRAAVSIDRFLRGQDLKADRQIEIPKVGRIPGEGMEHRARQETSIRPVAERTRGFGEINGGFSEEMAMLEAERCMTCGSKAYIAYPEDCMTCFTCALKCPYQAVDVHPFKEVLPRAITSGAR